MSTETMWVLKRDSNDYYLSDVGGGSDCPEWLWKSLLQKAIRFTTLSAACETLVEYAYWTGKRRDLVPPTDVFPVRVHRVERWEEVTDEPL